MKGEIAVRYTIRHFDLPLLTFEANMDSADTDLHIIKVYEENRSFLPLNLTVSEDGVERWHNVLCLQKIPLVPRPMPI